MKALALVACASLVVGQVVAQNRSTPQPRRGTAERSLVGVNLFDTGTSLIVRFGEPNDIQAIGVATAGVGPGAGAMGPPGTMGPMGPAGAPGRAPFGMPGGAGRGPGGGPAMGGAAASPAAALDLIGDPFGIGETMRQMSPELGDGAAGRMPPSVSGGGVGGPPPGIAMPPGFSPGGMGMPGRGGGVMPGGGMPGMPAGIPGMGAPGGAAPGWGGGQQAANVQFTRWVYNRPNSRYSFVLDRFNRVVQIETMGFGDTRPVTSRGVRFGTSFGDIIRRHGAPDAYDLMGDSMIIRYLNRDRVAFRLARVRPNGPFQVVGIVVAAGKP